MGGIVWIASYPKSGNTWTRVFIEALLTGSKRPIDLNALSITRFFDCHPYWYQQFDDKPGDAFTPEEVSALRPRVHQMIAATSADSIFVKTHSGMFFDRGTHTITMDVTAGAIYIVRNPLDVAISQVNYFNISLDESIERLCTSLSGHPGSAWSVFSVYGSWAENVDTWTKIPHESKFVMRYEDMLATPLKTFGGLAKFLGVPHGKGDLKRAIRASSFDALRKQEKKSGFAESSGGTFFKTGKSGQWKDLLSEAQVRRVIDVNGEQMKRFGYLPDGVA